MLGENTRELASKDLEYEFLGPLAGVGDTVVGTTAGPAGDFIVGFEMVSLNEKFKTLLNGRAAWGPIAAGNLCLLQTDDSVLRAYAADGTQAFEVNCRRGSPSASRCWSANRSSWLVRLVGWSRSTAGSGKLLGQTDLGQPISATPCPAGSRLLGAWCRGSCLPHRNPRELVVR